jgi:hypothetical protein
MPWVMSRASAFGVVVRVENTVAHRASNRERLYACGQVEVKEEQRLARLTS